MPRPVWTTITPALGGLLLAAVPDRGRRHPHVVPGRAKPLQGGVHLVLLTAFIFLTIAP